MIWEGIDDGTIRAYLDPFLASMYCMISFMGILSQEHKWTLVIEGQGFSCGQFTDAFFRFIAPALSSDGNPAAMDDREISGLPVTKPVASRKKKGKNRRVDIPEREESIPLFKERAKTLINAVCAEEISPTPDFQTCKYCDYWDFCKEGE